MLRPVKLCAGLMLAAFILAGCASKSSQNATELQVAAADNLAPVMRDLAHDYVARQPWVKITFHFANTATLEKDLQKTAFDLYIPARAHSVNALADHDVIAPKSRFLMAENQLVLIAPEDSTLPYDFNSAILDQSVRQIAVVDPNGHMLGYLTHQSLINLNLLPTPDSKPLVAADTALVSNLEPKLLVLPTEAEVLTALKDGRAQIGISYSTYAVADKNVHVLSPLPEHTYESITYYAVILRNAPNYDEAWNFLNYLRSPQARAIMQRDGLLVE
jgi:molybdate transport system substrate-binding protein